MTNETAEQLRRELFKRAREQDGTTPFGLDEVSTYVDDRRMLRVMDAHEQRVDRVRACAETDDGVHVLTLGTANANRGLVAGDDALTHFYAFVPGGRMVGPTEDEADDLAEQVGADIPVE